MQSFDKFLNTDFRIVINYDKKDENGNRVRHLIGRRGLQNLLGMELYFRTIKRAYSTNSEKITMRLRRGATLIFYRK